MKRTLKRAVVVAGLMTGCTLSSGPVEAFPTTAPLWGPTGLGTIPTTDTVPADTLELGADYERVSPDEGRVSYSPTLTGTIGFEQGELGLGTVRERISDTGFSDTNRLFVAHGKYRLLESERTGAAVAFGGHYLNLDNGDGHIGSLYLVGSYPFLRREGGQMLRGHLGALYQRIDLDNDQSETRPFAGLEFRPRQEITFAADYAPKSGDAPRFASLIARYEARQGLGVQIGVGRLQSDSKYFVGLTYRFLDKSR